MTLIALVVLAVIGMQALYNSHFFDLSQIKVTGVSHLTASQVVKESGAKKGQNLLRISPNDVADRIQKNSWVKTVNVNRRLPKVLEIEVIERKPFAIIQAKQGLFYVDDGGWIVDKAGDVTGSTLPRIADAMMDAKVGRKVDSDSLGNAIACLKGLDPALKSQIATLSVSSPDRLFLYTRDNIEILYGRAEDVDKKNQVIKTILSEKKGKLIFMDVRTVSNPIVKRLDVQAEQ